LIERTADPRPGLPALRGQLGRLARFSLILAARRWQRLVRRATPIPTRTWPLPPVAAGGSATVTVEFVPEQRGSVQFTGCWLARREPLGLFRALFPVRLPQSLLVLPRRYPVPALTMPGNRVYQHGGVTFATGVGDSEEFLGLREYRPGDPLQSIHWKSFARTGRPIVKEYQSEFFERHALVLDTFTDHADARFEEAVSVAASFACTIDTRESLLDLLFVGDRSFCYTAGRGHLQTEGLLEVLAHVEPCAAERIDRLGAILAEHRQRLSGCILVLLAWDSQRRQLVESLRASGLTLTCYLIVASGRATTAPALGVHCLEVGRIGEGLAAAGSATGPP